MSITLAIAAACIVLALLIVIVVALVLRHDDLRAERGRIRISENPFGNRPLPPAYCSCAAMKEACDCRALERAARSMCA